MAHQYSVEEIKKRYAELPFDIRQAISSPAVTDRLQDIGRAQGLRLDKIGLLVEEVSLVMIGLGSTQNFVSEIQEKLGISREHAETIAQQVDHEVFSRIRDSLRTTQYSSKTPERFGQGTDTQVVKYVDDNTQSSGVMDMSVSEAMARTDYDPSGFGSGQDSGRSLEMVPKEPTAPAQTSVEAAPLDTPIVTTHTEIADSAIITDFRDKLKSKMNDDDVTADPYRESVE